MERERIMSIVQTIFFCQLRTTASGTDTTLSVIDTEYGISGFFQFIIMTFRGQFFFCILGQIKGNRLLVIYGQFPAVISNTDIFAMIVASVFLRTHVIFMQITDTGSKFAKIACPAFINIALMRSVSKVFCLIHTF